MTNNGEPICSQCGGPVERNPSPSRQRTTCSDECRAELRRKSYGSGTVYVPDLETIERERQAIKSRNLELKRMSN